VDKAKKKMMMRQSVMIPISKSRKNLSNYIYRNISNRRRSRIIRGMRELIQETTISLSQKEKKTIRGSDRLITRKKNRSPKKSRNINLIRNTRSTESIPKNIKNDIFLFI
jgi:hypothetical protein